MIPLLALQRPPYGGKQKQIHGSCGELWGLQLETGVFPFSSRGLIKLPIF
jgi:hypothetical protein